MMSLGKEIRKARIDKGVRQKALAKEAIVSQKYLSNIENDKADPSFSIVQRIARQLGVSMAQLAGEMTPNVSQESGREA